MLTRSDLISGVLTLCGEPPDLPLSKGGLPINLIFETLTTIEAEMLRDLEGSPKEPRISKTEIALGGDDEQVLITAGDFHSPSFAYLQTDAASDIWWPVEIVERSAIGEATNNGKLAIALAGSPAYAYFSWVPESSQTLRFWYERGKDDAPTMLGSTELGSLYDEYLKLQTAAQWREYLKLEIGSILAARLVKSERQWQKFANKGNQRGSGFKSPAILTRRRYPIAGRTRIFLP